MAEKKIKKMNEKLSKPIKGVPAVTVSAGLAFGRDGMEPEELLKAVDGFRDELAKSPLVKSVSHGFMASTPQLELKLDRRKAEMLGLTPKVIFQTLQNKLASYYVNDFNIKGGVYEVKLQNDPDRRGSVKDIIDIRIPTSKGESVPISSLGSIEYEARPLVSERIAVA